MKSRFEALLLRLAARLLDRNVERSSVTSRHDNNRLFDMVYELRAIADRVESKYE